MSPSAAPPGVWTKVVYRKPPPSREFRDTPINSYSDAESFRDERDVFVRGIRSDIDRFTFEKDGLAFLKDPVDISNWTDEAEVRKVLLREMPELIKRHLGAKSAHITVERIRHPDSSGVKSDTTPVFAIHTDATPRSGLELLHNSLPKMDPVPKALPPHARILLVNVWRPLKTITRDPLAFLVPRSIKTERRHSQIFSRPAEKFKVFGKPQGDYWLDSASYGDQHEWVFLRHQQRDEPVIFLQWDSDGLKADKFESKMSVFHTCFEDSEYVNDPDRASMELKCLVFFDD